MTRSWPWPIGNQEARLTEICRASNGFLKDSREAENGNVRTGRMKRKPEETIARNIFSPNHDISRKFICGADEPRTRSP